MVESFLRPFTEGALHVGEHRLVEVAMELLCVLSAKVEVALSLLGMAITFPVLLVISLEDAKSAKAQGSVYVPVLISLDTYLVRTLFMERMEELSRPIVLGVVEVPLGLHRLHAHAHRHLHVVLVADVVEQVSIPLQVQEVVCPHGLHITIARGINVLTVVATPATCTTNALHVTCLGIKRIFEKTASEYLRRSFFIGYGGYIHWCSFINR